MDKNGLGLETNNGKEKKKVERTVFNILTNDDKIINNTCTWIIRDSVSTIPKYHYVNNEVSKQNQYLTSN